MDRMKISKGWQSKKVQGIAFFELRLVIEKECYPKSKGILGLLCRWGKNKLLTTFYIPQRWRLSTVFKAIENVIVSDN